MKRIPIASILVFLALVPLARAAEKPDAAALARTIEPYLDDTTLLIVRVDLARLDVEPVRQAIESVVRKLELPAQQTDGMLGALGQGMSAARQWVGEFTKAGGGEAYVVVNASNIPRSPLVGVIPLKAGADAGGLTKLIRPIVEGLVEDLVIETRGGALVWGGKAALARLNDVKPQQSRPDVAKAFEAAGDSTIQILFAPSTDTRRVLGQMLPRPPAELGGGSTEPVMRQVSWVGIGVTTSPGVVLRAVVQAPSSDSANALARTLSGLVAAGKQAILGAMGDDPNVAKLRPELEKLAGALSPKVEGDRLTIHLAADQTMAVAAVIMPAVARARAHAGQVQSASQIRTILQYCVLYANENKGQFPPDLGALNKGADMPAGLLAHPGGADISYGYLRPAGGSASPAEQVVIFEQTREPLDQLNVGFGDGHVERVDRARFEKLLAESRARNEQKR